jgi:anti-anti-sigma factor
MNTTKKSTPVIEARPEGLWIVLPDSIDMDNYHGIEEHIIPELATPGKTIILDFSNTVSLFSSGIGLILRIKKNVSDKNGSLVLVNMSDRLIEGLTNVGLDKILPMYATAEEWQKTQKKS